MICEHTSGGVVDSCHPDFIDRYGNRHFRRYPFGCLVIRTRKCTSCGKRFRTFELTEAQIAQFQARNAKVYSEVKAQVDALAVTVDLLQPEILTEAA